jgi:hypothetical protein
VIALRRGATIAGAMLALSVLGCGSDTASQPQPAPPRAVLAQVNRNCRVLLRQTKKLGEGVLKGSPEIQAMATERLVKPSIPLLEKVAHRQQALARRAHDPQLNLYAELFDPLIVLAQLRLSSGLEAERPGHQGEINRSRELEGEMTGIVREQMAVAGQAGIPACNVDFEQVLLSSLSG